MSDEPKLTVHSVPMLDTGIGREAGYTNDAEFIAVTEARRNAALAMLTPEARQRIEQAEQMEVRAFLFGAGDERTTGRNDGQERP